MGNLCTTKYSRVYVWALPWFGLTLLMFGYQEYAIAGNYCKVGKYVYHKSFHKCHGRVLDHCKKGKAYPKCSPTVVTTATHDIEQVGKYCFANGYHHKANSPICINKPIDQCRGKTKWFTCRDARNIKKMQTSKITIPERQPKTQPTAEKPAGWHAVDPGLKQAIDDLSNAENRADKGNKGEVTTTPAETQPTKQVSGKIPVPTKRPHYQPKSNRSQTSSAKAKNSNKVLKLSSYKCKKSRNSFQCMVCNCFHEARGENLRKARVGVNKVVVTRVGMASYPNSVCGVVYDSSQFSWTLSSSKRNFDMRKDKLGLRRCLEDSKAAIDFKGHFNSHYHTIWVKPKWRLGCSGRKQIGSHYFYDTCDGRSRAREHRQQSIAQLMNYILKAPGEVL